MEILNFKDFVSESISRPIIKKTAGVAVIFNNQILLVHPTNSGWRRPTCGIPKGGVEPMEDLKDAAVRELLEETGIRINPSQLKLSPEVVDFYAKSGEVRGQLTYYVLEIHDLSEIGLETLKLPKSMLQAEEIDWAKFVSPEDAYPIMSMPQRIILDRHLKMTTKL